MRTTTMQYRLLLLLALWLLGHHGILTSGCLEIEREALLTFKIGIIDTSNRLSSWAGRDCCSWRGVVCDNNTGHVVKLNLQNYCMYTNWSDYSLRGEINPSLLVLTHLSSLDLSWNDFGRISIPKFIGSLKSLMHLDLSGSNFSGKIPSLLALTHLSRLNLSMNDFGGISIPKFICSLKSLMHLDLYDSNFSGKIPSLLALTHLSHLDLSWNDFGGISIPKFIGSLKCLMHLDLSGSNFSGKIPSLLALTHLSHLDLSRNDFGGISIPKFIGSLKNLMHLDLYSSNFGGKVPSLLALTHLSHLDLSWNDFGGISIPKFICSLKGLMHLDLSGSNFGGKIPEQLGNLSNLRYLDLSYLNFICATPSQLNNLSRLHAFYLVNAFASDNPCVDNLSWLSQLSSIRVLYLSMVNLSNATDWLDIVNTMHFLTELSLRECGLSNIPTSLSHVNFTSLKFLYLDYNGPFKTTLPLWLSNLTKLSSLDLTSSGFHGKIPDSLGNLTSLSSLYLGYNDFDFGSIMPRSIKNLCNLRTIDLSGLCIGGDIAEFIGKLCSWKNIEELILTDNKLNGSLFGWLEEMKNLSYFSVYNNSLVGHVPPEIGKLSNLQWLDLSYNFLQGVISEAHFANLSKLEGLDLSSNSLIIDVDQNWIPPFQLSYLSLDSCRFLQPQFPAWLRSQMQLRQLTLSNTSIADTIPEWFWNLSFFAVDLSHNQIRGKLPMSLQFTNLEYLILRSNRLEGPIPSLPNRLVVIDLSNNSLSGELPQCWKNSFLLVLDLSNNNLAGEIPSSIGSLSSLTLLHLNNNNFYGELPLELKHCNNLRFLDLSNNKFTREIPAWIGENLQNLVILQLRSNMFVGEIPSELARVVHLQFLDLAHNNLTGSIPRSFGNLSAMFYDGNGYTIDKWNFTYFDYSSNLLVVMHGEEYQYSTTIYLLKMMDLSKNNLSGQIPEEIVALALLRSLDLSGNNLTGTIPKRLGDMRSLELLDLSLNKLQGAIPQSLTTLTFLSNLNLSYNNLSGRIPTENQLSTLNSPSIYMGNTYLCGPPTGKSCSENETMPDVVGDNYDGSKSTWPYLGMGLGFAAGLWSVCGILIFKKSWSIAYFQIIDRLYDKIYVIIAISMRRLNRKMHG